MSQREKPSRACKRSKSDKNSDSAIGGDSVSDSGSEFHLGKFSRHFRVGAISPDRLLPPISDHSNRSFSSTITELEGTLTYV